jgi:hypothetical protein
MSTIKVDDVAFVRFRAPDLATMKSFLRRLSACTTQVRRNAICSCGEMDRRLSCMRPNLASRVSPASPFARAPSPISKHWPRAKASKSKISMLLEAVKSFASWIRTDFD